MTLDSTVGTIRQLRTHLLTFTPLVGDTLLERLGTGPGPAVDGRLYVNQAPDGVKYVDDAGALRGYGVLRLLSDRETPGHRGNRMTADLELMLYARPRSQQIALEGAADVCDQAMKAYLATSGGLIFARSGRLRNALPPFQDPADREVVQIHLSYPVGFWPQWLTQYDT